MSRRTSMSAEEAEERMREIVAAADLPPPDEVEQDFEADELILIWHEPPLALVVELSERLPQPPV